MNDTTKSIEVTAYLRVNIQRIPPATDWEATADANPGDPPQPNPPQFRLALVDHHLPQVWGGIIPLIASPKNFDAALLEAKGKAEAEFRLQHPDAVVRWMHYPRALATTA